MCGHLCPHVGGIRSRGEVSQPLSFAASVVCSNDGLGLSVLLPLIFAVLLLLFMVASLVAWRMAKRPKKGEGTGLTLGWAG